MALVKVWTDVGARKPVALIAKIIEKDGVILTIKYLTEGPDHVWRYEDDTYEIDDDSVAEYLKTDLEDDIGFRRRNDGFVKVDSDEDYIPNSSEDGESTDDEEDVAEDFTESGDESGSEESLCE